MLPLLDWLYLGKEWSTRYRLCSSEASFLELCVFFHSILHKLCEYHHFSFLSLIYYIFLVSSSQAFCNPCEVFTHCGLKPCLYRISNLTFNCSTVLLALWDRIKANHLSSQQTSRTLKISYAFPLWAQKELVFGWFLSCATVDKKIGIIFSSLWVCFFLVGYLFSCYRSTTLHYFLGVSGETRPVSSY